MTLVCCSVLQCVAVCRSALRCVALQSFANDSSVLQDFAECCSASQCVAVCCSVLQCVALRKTLSNDFKAGISNVYIKSPGLYSMIVELTFHVHYIYIHI